MNQEKRIKGRRGGRGEEKTLKDAMSCAFMIICTQEKNELNCAVIIKIKELTSKYSSQAALCFIAEALKPSTKQITHS